MKKIIILAKSFGGGGSEVALIELLNHIDYEKYKIKILLLDKDDEYLYRLNKNVKVTVEYLKFKKLIFYKLVSMYSLYGKVLKKIKLNKYIKFYEYIMDKLENDFSDEYDIALDFYGYGYFSTGLLANKIVSKKKATWIHDENISWFPNISRYVNKIDKLICVSNACKNSVDNEMNFDNKTMVVYNVLDIQNIIAKSKEFLPKEFDEDVYKILTIGRLHNQKGIDIAIKSAKILKDKNINYKWYVIGMGNKEKYFNVLIKKYKLENNFVLLGKKENPYPYLKYCDLYVQLSRHEGYGLSVLEARILSKVILVSNIPALTEQITNNKNGYVVSLDYNDIAKKISDIYYKKIEICNKKESKVNFCEEINKIYSM